MYLLKHFYLCYSKLYDYLHFFSKEEMTLKHFRKITHDVLDFMNSGYMYAK
jgi:hypothetical protein